MVAHVCDVRGVAPELTAELQKLHLASLRRLGFALLLWTALRGCKAASPLGEAVLWLFPELRSEAVR